MMGVLISIGGRALGLSEEQIRLFSVLNSIRTDLGGAPATASSLSRLADEIRSNLDATND